MTDAISPLVFINSRDAKAAQIFTLMHELAHIWIGKSGVSNPDPTKTLEKVGPEDEQRCNDIAAEILLPHRSLLSMWDQRQGIDANVNRIAREYRVSTLVALRRANDNHVISDADFKRRAKAAYARAKANDMPDIKREEEKRGNFWPLFTMRNSQTFTDTVVAAARAGRLGYIKAGHLLDVTATTVEAYQQKFHAAY
jgi:Zn-dependent peptidase ImmA (M78 family)